MVNVLTLLKRTGEKVSSRYLVGLITSSLNGAIFCDMTLSVCLRGFDRQYLKNDANKGRR